MSVPSAAYAHPAATAAADPPLEPPVMCDRSHGLCVGTVVRVVIGRPVGELAHVRLADDDRARTPQPAHDGGVVDGDEAGEDLRPGSGAQPRGPDVVLERHGHAVQRPAVAPTQDFGFGAGGLAAGPIGIDRDERVQTRPILLDAAEQRLDQLARRHLAGGHERSDLLDGHPRQVR